MLVIGIDPGVSGAVAVVDSRGTCDIEDMPTVEIPGDGITKRKLCGRGLAEVLRRLIPADEKALVFLEDVRLMPSRLAGGKSGGAANTSLMHSKGVIEGVLGVLRLEPRMVSARRWKAFYGLVDGDATDTQRKAAGLNKARVLYPNAQHLLKLVKHHNRGEALLIAHYGLRKFE